jgi:hypothetical protein
MSTVRSDSNDSIIDVDCDQASPTTGLLNTGVITDKSGRGFMLLDGTWIDAHEPGSRWVYKKCSSKQKVASVRYFNMRHVS